MRKAQAYTLRAGIVLFVTTHNSHHDLAYLRDPDRPAGGYESPSEPAPPFRLSGAKVRPGFAQHVRCRLCALRRPAGKARARRHVAGGGTPSPMDGMVRALDYRQAGRLRGAARRRWPDRVQGGAWRHRGRSVPTRPPTSMGSPSRLEQRPPGHTVGDWRLGATQCTVAL